MAKKNNEVLEDEIEELDELELITVTGDDGTEMQFYIIDCREYKGKSYVVLLPAEESTEYDELSIFEITYDEEDAIFTPIEDEALLEEIYADFLQDYDPEQAGYESNGMLPD